VRTKSTAQNQEHDRFAFGGRLESRDTVLKRGLFEEFNGSGVACSESS
jgi:hypothetical protein